MLKLRRAWGWGEERFQRRIVLSKEQERNVSEAGQRARVVTGAVCPRK